jgi:cyanate permease
MKKNKLPVEIRVAMLITAIPLFVFALLTLFVDPIFQYLLLMALLPNLCVTSFAMGYNYKR